MLRDLELAEKNLEIVITELRATLGKMELALGSINEAIVWTGEDTGIQWCNATFDRLVNKSHIAILGNPLPNLLPLAHQGKEVSQTKHPVLKVLTQEFATTEYEFIKSDKILILEISGSCLSLKNGDKAAVMTIRDITERKRMESALISANRTMANYLQEVDKVIAAAVAVENDTFVPEILDSVAARTDELGRLARVFTQMVQQLKARERELAQAKEQLEAVLNAVPGSISWIDDGGLYIGVNRYLAENFKLSQDAFIGQEVGFLQGSAQMAEFMHQFIASPQISASSVIDLEINNNKRYYLVAAQKYQQGSATVSVGIDITERKQAEEALRIAEENYRSIFENALEGIFQSTREGHYISVNPAMSRIYGYDSPQEMIVSVREIGTQMYVNPNCREQFARLMEETGKVKDLEYQIYRRDGSIIWVQENTRAVRDTSGKLLYYEGIVQDISERKRREDELKRQLAELKVEIDQKKREQEVALITKSGYFQELQSNISEVNLDEFWE
ncbi:MAG: PAS domain S-box protein [Scytonematopsis contorta HA4267-MV1]|jgi:PAS domain S-box-containing protein|nr:PAS domain S-box protein [Scytonematopsis contorta HA4267-MV1]